jgi:hypothetical protein
VTSWTAADGVLPLAEGILREWRRRLPGQRLPRSLGRKGLTRKPELGGRFRISCAGKSLDHETLRDWSKHTAMQTQIVYWVTADGTIERMEARISTESAQRDPVFADSFGWSDFVGCNLFSFIAGMAVRHLYAILHENVLKTARAITFNCRCDGPDVIRHMSMSLAPDGDLVRYESRLLKEEPRTAPIPLSSPGASTLVPICSMCKNYQFPPDCHEWKEIELLPCEAELPQHFDFTHGLCPRCLEQCMKNIQN